MRILQIDKFLQTDAPASGGLGSYMPVVTRLLRRAGHSVLHFGCALDGRPEASQMPRFVDYAALTGLTAKFAGAVRILHDSTAAARLDAFLATHRADVAHVHRIYHHLTPSILPVLRRRGVAVVMSMRDYRLFCPVKAFLRNGRACTGCLPHRYWRCVVDNCAGSRPASAAVALETFFQRFFRRYVQNVAFFLCPSHFMAGVLAADGVPANKIRRLPHPVSAPPLPADASPAETVLYVGRLSPEKGPDLMLELAEALPQVPVEVVGDGPIRDCLARQVKARRLGNVVMPGHVPRRHLGEYYGRAAVVVLPSRCYENSPYAMLEAMSAGRCVVAPDHGPIGEWIRDGHTGRLFRPGDGTDLVRVVRQVLSDPAGREAMARAGRRMVHTNHQPDDVVCRLLAVYQEAMRRCGSP